MVIIMNVKDIAEDIGLYLISKYGDSCSTDTLDKECYEAVASLKGDLYDETEKYLKKNNFKLY